MANARSLLSTDIGWAAAPKLLHAMGAAAFLAIAVLTTYVIRDSLPEPSGLFVFFIAVLLASVRFGFWIGIASALSAFGLYNFLFVTPLYTFAIAKSGDLLVLAEFLGTAGLTGFLAGRLREEVNAANSRAAVLEVLSAFAADLAAATGTDVIQTTLAAHTEALALGPAVVLVPRTGGFANAALEPEDLQSAERAMRRQAPQDSAQPGQQGGRFAFLPLVQDGEVILLLGYHRLAADRPDRVVREQAIAVICHQANLAIERLRFAASAEEARTAATRDSLRAALLTSLSHDLRTPLATILGAITSLRQLGETLPSEARDDLAAAIEEETRRLSHYVDNLLQMTRLQAGLDLHLTWVDPADVVRAAIARANRAFVRANIKSDLPDLPMLQLEAALLEQAIFNLLDNAIKFSPPSAPIIVTAAVSDRLSITVTDQGPGIAPAAQTKIFQPFFRANTQQLGTGLGLTISAGIVQAMGGSLVVISPASDGKGTSLCISFPLPKPNP